MPEERDIEKQLRAAAEQRKQAAGGKFELHPASRRVLQGEVARTRGTVALTTRARWWPRLAWGGAFALFMVVAVGLWWKPRGKEPAALAEYEAKTMTVALKTAAPAKQAAGQKLARAASQPELAAAEPLADRVPEAEILVAQDKAQDKAKAEAGHGLAAAPAPSSPAAVVVAAEASTALGAMASPDFDAAANRTYFANTAANAGANNYANNAPARRDRAKVSVADLKLLNTFNFQQDGEVVRIVDQDGSVYTGKLLAEAKVASANQKEAVLAKKTSPGAKPTTLGAAAKADALTDFAANPPPLPPGVKFMASGTNLSLRQRVLFNGALVQVTNGTPGATWNINNGTSDQQLRSRFQNSLNGGSNSRLVGRAVTADGQSVEVDAEPVPLK